MPDENAPRKQQSIANANKSVLQNGQVASSPDTKRSERNSGKGSSKSRVGGSAVQGAKSTLPKQAPATSDPNEQQLASYNRTMRRRAEKMGTTSTDRRMQNVQEQRRKRAERRRERLDAQRAEIRKSMPGLGKITLGRKNTLFIIGAILLVVGLIVVFVILRTMHIIN